MTNINVQGVHLGSVNGPVQCTDENEKISSNQLCFWPKLAFFFKSAIYSLWCTDENSILGHSLHQVLIAIHRVAFIVSIIIGIINCVFTFGITSLFIFVWIYHDKSITWKYLFDLDRIEHKHVVYKQLS